ncbi:NEK protein kinase [Kwoniella heveanensis BCC8398]|uniref:non-specific serine/threonine protein kinase n=1 Tax=Kwoniella heveanensis BCC8398 TaxID=1296120 RepID=A0A1B9H4K1_9TREE|nr:NEK protein kinase [Kwoniella heveanensis BCC8398]
MASAMPRRSAANGNGTGMGVGSGYADVSEMDKYKLVSNIGKGSFGVISKVQRVTDGKEFALKQLDYSKMTEKDRKQILAEVAILESLKHRNIVQLIQKIKDPKNERIYIVMEYCTSGDLGSLIRKAQRTNQPLHEDKIWNIFLQITLALHHCHCPAERPSKLGVARMSSGQTQTADGGIARYQVLHRDLKPENVFLSDDFVKLGDFGLSKDMGTSSFTSTYVGTPLYMPPEILAENRYDTKSDIWSLGCLVYEMCALHSPFHTAQTQAELISMVKSGRLPALPSQYSLTLRSVIKAMLTLNPVKRPSTKDLLEMDEMRLHRKLFTVQNQTSLLFAKRDELKNHEEQLRAKAASLDEREKAIATREANLQAREAICDTKEEEAKETQKRLNQAAESLRGQWERFREEKENASMRLGLPVQEVRQADARQGKSSLPATTRPALEERNTLPLPATSRCSRLAHPAYADTPSKIPLASMSSPAPLDSRFATLGIQQPRAITPMRKNATKSLGNLAAAARADAERDAAWAAAEATPAKQILGGPSSHRAQQRTSIGSPSELTRGTGMGVYCEDITMASMTGSPMSIASPWLPRPRRSSVAPTTASSQQYSSSSTAAAGSATASATGSGSGYDSASSSSASGESRGSGSGSGRNTATVSLPPTQIPAPTFVYREAATPAKWALEDPDLPSPFLRRANTAPIPSTTTTTAYNQETRQPLGAISMNPAVQSQSQPNSISVPSFQSSIIPARGNIPAIGKSEDGQGQKMTRRKSGTLNLHQHVLRHNAVMAGRTSGEGVAGAGSAGTVAAGSGEGKGGSARLRLGAAVESSRLVI